MTRILFLASLLALAFVPSCAPVPNAPPPPVAVPVVDDYPHLLLGNPSGATADPADRNNFLMKKKYFALSYHSDHGIPNWVSWRVTKDDLGEAPRKQVFDTDAELPKGFRHIAHKDYTGGGFDRGHMCPHSDRAADTEMSYATFVMTNVIPQAPKVNQKTWAALEIYLRGQVKRGHHVHIIAGPAGQGGRGTNGPADAIDGGKVVVPAQCWKVALILPVGEGDDVSKITAETRVIAVIMPNDEEKIDLHWAKYRTSVSEVEKLTGYTFFDRLPTELATALKAEVDKVHIATSHKTGGDE